jgi:hypothetical protein
MNKIDIHNLTKKQRRQMHSWLRAAIQLLYFLFLPSAYTAAFAGVVSSVSCFFSFAVVSAA